MKNLLQLNRVVSNFKFFKGFMKLEVGDKLLIIRVFILTAIMRCAMLFIPFRILRKYIGQLNKESSLNLSDNKYMIAQRISWSIMKVSNHTLWESKCLVQALTAQYLLSRAQIENTIYLGVSIKNQDVKNIKEKDKVKLVAHAWIRCGSYYVTGGDGNGFKVVAKFAK